MRLYYHRLYYHRLKKVIKLPEGKLIAIDETKLKLENKQIFVWSARDVETGEILFVWASDGRSSFILIFLKEVPRYCENKPEVVDRRFWYVWALNRLAGFIHIRLQFCS